MKKNLLSKKEPEFKDPKNSHPIYSQNEKVCSGKNTKDGAR